MNLYEIIISIIIDELFRYVIKEHSNSNEMTSVLEIYNVDIRDSGLYSCVASNAYGSDETLIQLNVRGSYALIYFVAM